MHQRIIGIPPSYESRIERLLAERGYSLSAPKALADAVLRLSSFYLENPSATTPWHELWAQAASLVYYFPLNRARAFAVAMEAERLGFFDGLDTLIDFGSGMGSALHAFADRLESEPEGRLESELEGRLESELEGRLKDRVFTCSLVAIDVSEDALRLNQSLAPNGRSILARSVRPVLSKLKLPSSSDQGPSFLGPLQRSAVMASYALTELEQMPKWWLESEALIVIEPATRDDGRRLMDLRQRLIDSGHSIWAPCTHAGACPLLENSLRDWCHDRIHFDAPDWFLQIEKFLPIKNRTLTFSYLLARKTQRAPHILSSLGRLVGDTLEEKGKNRQALCRGHEREFLAWFPQRMPKQNQIDLNRGNLVRLAKGLEKKASELRLRSPDELDEIRPDEILSDPDRASQL